MGRVATMRADTLAAVPRVGRPQPTAARGAASAAAYAALKHAIVHTALKPGAALSEAEVALKMGLSRTPVREAFRRLAAEKLVIVAPQVGTIVARLSRRTLYNALFVRNALECAAVRLAVAAPASQRDSLRHIVARQRAAIAANDIEMNLVQDQEFHRVVMMLSGHEEAWPLVMQARSHLDRLRRLAIPELHGNEEAVEHHTAIARAIADGDARQAEILLSEHIYLAASFIDRILAAHPDYFESGEDTAAADESHHSGSRN
jgi:DNA-binding GntR family transcriptional regulator